MESWGELSNPRDLAKQFDATEYMAWRAFRDTNDSRYMALTMPRFLGRNLYGANSEPVEEFVPDLLFQIQNLLAERRLADVCALGRAGEISRVSNSDSVAELA